MRTKKAMINVAVSCLSYVIILVGSFVTRQLFVRILGLEMVGIEGAFTGVVTALAIVELGLGVGVVYKLYRPIAEKNWDQVAVVLCFLRRCYIVVASAVFALGVVSAYFVVIPIKGDFSKIWLARLFILYVIDVVASYLFSHKRAMFTADQKNYVNNLIHIFIQILLFASQIWILNVFASFEIYLICKIFFRVAENVVISYRFNKKYGFIDLKTKNKMPDIEKKDLFKNIKALFLHKIAGFGSTTLSNIIIMYFMFMRENGIYHNYMLIVMALTTITNEIFNGILASFGNLLNTSSRKKVYANFNVLYFLNFLLYSFIVSAFLCLSAPFVNAWIGDGSAFGIGTTLAITGYLYIYGIRQSIGMAKVGAGIYDQDKYMALVGAGITLVSSLVLAPILGITGVMIGNIVGIILVPYWVQPYLVYDIVFKKRVRSYHQKFLLYTALTAAYAFITYSMCGWAQSNFQGLTSPVLSFLINLKFSEGVAYLIVRLIVNGVICLIVPNVLNILLFFRTQEFKDLFAAAKNLIRRVKAQ